MEDGEVRNYRKLVGENIRRLRVSQGLSLRRFGMMIGMDYSYLHDIEHGKANATIDALAKISAGLEIDLADLFRPA